MNLRKPGLQTYYHTLAVKLAQAEAKVKVADREKAELSFHMTKLKDEIQELR
jgi:hypothetical protein